MVFGTCTVVPDLLGPPCVEPSEGWWMLHANKITFYEYSRFYFILTTGFFIVGPGWAITTALPLFSSRIMKKIMHSESIVSWYQKKFQITIVD